MPFTFKLPQEGEGFRAAASSRMHRLTLHFFKANRSLKRAPPPLRFLIQVLGGAVWVWEGLGNGGIAAAVGLRP